MNYIDLIILLIILMGMASGWLRGFAISFLHLASWLGSLALGLLLYPHVAGWVENLVNGYDVFIPPLSFLLVVFLAGVFLHRLSHYFIGKISGSFHRNRANKALGLFPGAINGSIISAIMVAAVLALPLPGFIKQPVQQSRLADRFACAFDHVESMFFPIFEDAAKKTLNNLTISPESDRSIELPFTVSEVRIRPDLEARMLELINGERQDHGFEPLAADTALREVARSHSVDMFRRGYFSHHTPEGNDPFDRIRSAGIIFVTAGENLALAQTLNLAHNSLMNSPGHRANILKNSFGNVGIGVIDGGIHGLMVTQKFKN